METSMDPPTKKQKGSEMKFNWLGQPLLEDGEGQYYEKVQISMPTNPAFTLQQGDTASLETPDGRKLCLIDRFYVLEDGSEAYIEGNWFLSKEDIVSKIGQAKSDEQANFLDSLRENEVVVGKTRQRNPLSLIRNQDASTVKYVPEHEDMNKYATFPIVCRFRVELVEKTKEIKWKPFLDSAGDDERAEDDDGTATADGTLDTGTALSGSDDDSVSDSSMSTAGNVIRGEGEKLREEIQVGSAYQMCVAGFDGPKTVSSRGAKCVYKANALTDEVLTSFLKRVAPLQADYLRQNKMLMMEPYLLLDSSRVDEFAQGVPEGYPVTGSFMSTASMISGERVPLTKETSAEDLLEILQDNDYDPQKALMVVEQKMDLITNGFTRAEKAIYDDGFRRHEGQLRLIGSALSPTKTNKEVVDYHYRFKIPDQFRKYQEKKREQAIRMARCIETRKYSDAIGGSSGLKNRGDAISDKSAMALTESKDERVKAAKKLLLEVKYKLGKETLGKVAAVVRQLQSSYDKDAKDELFKLLSKEKDLQKRILDFLPKHAI